MVIGLCLGIVQALISPDGDPPASIEQLLPSETQAELEALRSRFGGAREMIVIALHGAKSVTADRLSAIETELWQLPAITHTWSAASVAQFAADVWPQSRLLSNLLRPAPGVAVIAAFTTADSTSLAQAEMLNRAIAERVGRHLDGSNSFEIVGTPQLRLASWHTVWEDLRYLLPSLVAVVALVSLTIYRSPTAVLFPLTIASISTLATLALLHGLGTPGTLLHLILVPVIWSVSTMDAYHLYDRTRKQRQAGNPAAIDEARRSLYRPCLYTTLTTAAGFAALSLQDQSFLIGSFGLWGAAGTLIAYIVTFSLGGWLLRLDSDSTPMSDTITLRLATVVGFSQRHRRLVIGGWLLALALAAIPAARLGVEIQYPHIFAGQEPVAKSLRDLADSLDSDLRPIDIYLTPSDGHGLEDPAVLPQAMLATSAFLNTLDETRLVLPYDLLALEEKAAGEHPVSGDDLKASPGAPLQQTDRQQLARQWIIPDAGIGRIQLHLAPMPFSRLQQLMQWLAHFDDTMLSHHKLTLDGTGYQYYLAENRSIQGMAEGALYAFCGVGLVCLLAFRNIWLTAVILAGCIAPLALTLGLAGMLGIPWSLALLPLPAILIGLAIDDGIHLLWTRGRIDMPGERALSDNARTAGTALLTTTLILAGSLLTLVFSGLLPNQQLGLLLASGLLLALAGSLTLTVSLATSSPGRSDRPPP